MEHKCLFAFDLDGTLLNDERKIVPATKKAIRQLLKKGHIVCLVSGRVIYQAVDFIKDLELKHYYIGNAGGFVYCLKEKKEFHLSKPFSFQDKLNALALAIAYQRELTYYDGTCLWKMYFGKNVKTDVKDRYYFLASTSTTYFLYDDQHLAINNFLNKNVYHINIKVESFRVEELVNTLNQKLSEHLVIHVSSRTILEITNKNINKFNALSFILEREKILPENMYCFGDSGNDVEMLTYCHNSVAMGNAIDKIKKIAKYVIGDNNSDGIYLFLKEQNFVE